MGNTDTKPRAGKIFGIILCVLAVLLTVAVTAAYIFISGQERAISDLLKATEGTTQYTADGGVTPERLFELGVSDVDITYTLKSRSFSDGFMKSEIKAEIRSGEEESRSSALLTFSLEYDGGWRIVSVSA